MDKSRHTIKEDLESIEREQTYFRLNHSARFHGDKWKIPLSVKTTSAILEAEAEEYERAKTEEYGIRFCESVFFKLPPEEYEAKLKFELEDREAARQRQKAEAQKKAKQSLGLPDVVEFNFILLLESALSPKDMAKVLKTRKLSVKTVEDVLKALPVTADVRAGFDETHRVLQITTTDPQYQARIALDAEQKPRKFSRYEDQNGASMRGTFWNILKGKTDGS